MKEKYKENYQTVYIKSKYIEGIHNWEIKHNTRFPYSKAIEMGIEKIINE